MHARMDRIDYDLGLQGEVRNESIELINCISDCTSPLPSSLALKLSRLSHLCALTLSLDSLTYARTFSFSLSITPTRVRYLSRSAHTHTRTHACMYDYVCVDAFVITV